MLINTINNVFATHKIRTVLFVIICASSTLIIGWGSSLFQVESLVTWYPYLQKSILTPPNIVFPIVWGILYLMIGSSLGLILSIYANIQDALRVHIKSESFMPMNSGKSIMDVFVLLKRIRRSMSLFAFQFILNFLWSYFFFYLHDPLLGFIDILAILIISVIYLVNTFYIGKAAAWLFVPYIMWLMLATYLNGFILFRNS